MTPADDLHHHQTQVPLGGAEAHWIGRVNGREENLESDMVCVCVCVCVCMCMRAGMYSCLCVLMCEYIHVHICASE